MRVLLTHTNFLEYGGAERLLEVVAELYPNADILTLVAEPDAVPASLRNRRIVTSFMDRIPKGRKLFRHLGFLAPLAIEALDVSAYDLVISCDGTFTKGVLTSDRAVHVCYCHSPHRSIWDRQAEYREKFSGLSRVIFALSSHYLRLWDFQAAQHVDLFLSNSVHVSKRIQKYYRRDSVVVYGPANVEAASATGRIPGDYYLSVGRLDASKRVDILIQACRQLKRKLIIVGSGPQEKYLRDIADPTIEFRGWVSPDELAHLYHHCKALLFASYEDFGLVPVEAQSYGAPVIAYGAGGALETVVPGLSGLHFPEQNSKSLADAILSFESLEREFSPEKIRESSLKFSTEAFKVRMKAAVDEAIARKYA
jgi:glycosyltransferase involved in cell wall biosynthesis